MANSSNSNDLDYQDVLYKIQTQYQSTTASSTTNGTPVLYYYPVTATNSSTTLTTNFYQDQWSNKDPLMDLKAKKQGIKPPLEEGTLITINNAMYIRIGNSDIRIITFEEIENISKEAIKNKLSESRVSGIIAEEYNVSEDLKENIKNKVLDTIKLKIDHILNEELGANR